MITRTFPVPFLVSLALIAAAAVAFATVDERIEAPRPRDKLVDFPMRIEVWRGRQSALEKQIVDALHVDDYVIADYHGSRPRDTVNFYVAYYASQSSGQSAHSPSSCIPGGGWEIDKIGTYPIPHAIAQDRALVVNRVQISKGNVKQLVYYWFEQRGRRLTNEYGVKWYLMWDGITRNRTDGALVRLVTPIFEGDSVAGADERLTEFVQAVYPRIASYIPS